VCVEKLGEKYKISASMRDPRFSLVTFKTWGTLMLLTNLDIDIA